MRQCIAVALGAALGMMSVGGYGATIDTTTGGNWIGKYGSQGYILMDYGRAATNSNTTGVYDATASTGNDVSSLPSYVTGYSYSGFQQYLWTTNQTDPRDLQNPADPTGLRNASTSFINNDGNTQTITLNINTPTTFQLGVYGLDWDNYNGRDATVTVNGDSAELDNNNPAGAYHNGEWALFNVTAPAGPLVISFKGNGPGNSNSVLSGITFDAVPEPATFSILALAGTAVLRRVHRP